MRNPNYVKPKDDEDGSEPANDSDSGVSTDMPAAAKSSTKRKLKPKNANKAKKLKSDKLTAAEIKELKETDDLYHSNLFRMQIDETLKEVKLRNKQMEFIDKWVVTFRKFLLKLPTEELTLLAKHKDYPMKLKTFEGGNKLQMSYKPPLSVALYGSHSIQTNIGEKSSVDVLLTMPNDILLRTDYVNQVYMHKKALYIFHISRKLQEMGTLGENIKIVNIKNDPLKPVIRLEAEDYVIEINAVPSEDFFKLNRFVPSTNNIKFKTGDESVVPTPHYNFEILYDCNIERTQKLLTKEIGAHENVKSAIKLLKIWAHQRDFDAGFYPFNGFIISCYIIHLLKLKKVYPSMSCYQIIRLFWNQFGNSKLDQTGISLCQEKNLPAQPTVHDFHAFYDVVMVDPTGFGNILSMFSVDLYQRVREECLKAIQMLDNKSINSFHQLFLTNIPFYLQFDQVLSIKYDEKWYQTLVDRYGSNESKIDFHNLTYPNLRKIVMDVLRKGLSNRVSAITPVSRCNNHELIVGIVLNPENAFNIVDKGPQSNEPEAQEFRKFWGEKAEIRRFKDGSITESVLWCPAGAPIGEKRLICQKIVLFLMRHHFHIITDKINYIASQFDITIKNIFNELNETNEERSLLAIRTFDQLSKELRALNDLPLEIVSVLGTDPIFRYADVTPPMANGSTTSRGFLNKQMKGKFRAQKIINGIIQLSPSGKWPDDLDAMRRIKGAFYLEIEKKMKAQYPETTVQVYSDWIEAMKDKLLYRLKIVHPKEIALAKQYISSANNLTKLYKNSEESLLLEFQGSVLPKLTSSLHGLHHQFPSFGPTVAIAKRWLYSQMIDSFLWPDECTELIVAEMILKSVPMAAPLQPQTGFLRFLHQLANVNYENEMVTVNFNEDLSSEQLEELEENFRKSRKRFPPLFIVTSCDFNNHGIWSAKAPSLNLLQRVRMLAKHSIDIIGENFTKLTLNIVKDLFTPSLAGYDMLIELNQEFVKRHDVVLSNFSTFKPVQYDDEKFSPPAGVDFVQSFLNEIREAFDDFALFFYNPIGGNTIAILWKPSANETREFAVSHVSGCKLENARLRVDIESLIHDIEIIGKGLIRSIEILN